MYQNIKINNLINFFKKIVNLYYNLKMVINLEK